MAVSAFINFLVDRTHNLAVLGAIAAHGANNLNNVAEFLQQDGARYGLPITMEGLQKAWEAWVDTLAQKY